MLDSDPNQDGPRKRAGRSDLLLILTVAAAFIVAALVSYLGLDWRAR